MPTNTTPPIQVNGSTLPATLGAALRYGVATLGTFLVSKGYVNAENIDGIATLAVTVVTVLYGLYRTHNKQTQLITTAEAAPNSIAQVK